MASVKLYHRIMKAIIIAAGRGGRMGALADNLPKTLIPIAGKPLLDHLLKNMRDQGISSIALVRGYQAEKFTNPDLRYYLNAEYPENNILHSLMKAGREFDDDLVISYSDIWYSPAVLQSLLHTPGDIVISVDTAWSERYEGRLLHPWSEAEKVFFDAAHTVEKIGKHLPGDGSPGEFIGLFKLSRAGARLFREQFEEVNRRLSPRDPFEQAKEWRKAYITDFLQFLSRTGHTVSCSLHEKGWLEMDTPEDYEKAADILRSS